MKTGTLSGGPVAWRTLLDAQRIGEPTRALQIRNVLVPVDFSVASLEAIEFALPLVKRFGADLHIVHVFEPYHSLASTAAVPLLVPELEVGRPIHRHLKNVARDHGIELRRENIHCLKGRAFEEICSLARDDQMDLIVIATRGNTGLKCLALGSTAERVVRYSPCPVLVVRGAPPRKKSTSRNGSSQTTNLKKIVVPIDFSDCSMKALAYAKGLAKEFGAKLILLNSVHLHYYVTSDEYARYDFADYMQRAEKFANEQLTELIRTTDWEGIKVEPSLQIGHAGDQICARARDQGADLIVTSTHGRTGLKHVLIGSTAEYVVRHAHCPVLVVPSHEHSVIKSTPARI